MYSGEPPGGKEYVCGFDFAHISVHMLLYYLVPSAWLASLAAGGVALVKGGLGKGEKVAWIASLNILVGFVLAVTFSNDDMP